MKTRATLKPGDLCHPLEDLTTAYLRSVDDDDDDDDSIELPCNVLCLVLCQIEINPEDPWDEALVVTNDRLLWVNSLDLKVIQ